jgi:Pyridoxal phosphate biosynthetic protein PdxA
VGTAGLDCAEISLFPTAWPGQVHNLRVPRRNARLGRLMGFEPGITIAAGLPVPITTPTRGTAFDIAGRNLARVDAPQRSSPAIPARAPCGRAPGAGARIPTIAHRVLISR